MTAKRTAVNGLVLWLFGMAVGIFLCQSGYAFEPTGQKWAKEYVWELGGDCSVLVELFMPVALASYGRWIDYSRGDDFFDVPSIRDDKSTVYCSDAPVITEKSEEINGDWMSSGNAKWRWPITQNLTIECDIWIAQDAFPLTILKILRHELGHCFGLGHSDIEDAIMYHAPSGNRLHVDDMAGMATVYGDCAIQIDRDGNKFMPRLDVQEILATLDNEEFEIYENQILSAFIDAGSVWYDGVYGVGLSECE